MDYAQRLVSLLSSAGSQRANVARAFADQADRNGNGTISGDEFQAVFATLQADPTRMPDLTGSVATVHRTIFADTLYPSFSRNRGIAAYMAQEAVAGLDMNADGAISAAELAGTATQPVPPTSAERADDLLTRYDTAGKGYVDLVDIQAAWTKDPTLGDPAKAQAAIDAFDRDSNGKVTRDELKAGYDAMDQADAMLAIFDPKGTGAINLANAASISSADYPDAAATFARWDGDHNGQLTRPELIAGIEADAAAAAAQKPTTPETPTQPTDPALLAATLLAQYDSDASGGISAAEFASHAQVADATATFAAWDTNSDGELTLEELQTGIGQVQQAQAIVKQYDLAGKGYFDEADLAAALDPATVPDVAAQAHQIMSFWDANGDGQVSVAEVVSGIAVGGYVGGEQLKTTSTT